MISATSLLSWLVAQFLPSRALLSRVLLPCRLLPSSLLSRGSLSRGHYFGGLGRIPTMCYILKMIKLVSAIAPGMET